MSRRYLFSPGSLSFMEKRIRYTASAAIAQGWDFEILLARWLAFPRLGDP